ncbi:MAG: helicase [Microbacterium sp.]|uniref:helicase-related protein n=1 Tax=Microbacterium sp. TaxID=51671 RepID=UPI0019B716A6|nr:helicase-related protein [Microbacterium sp.]MBD3756807.1 helicase [Microbacterium sp.]
MSAVDVDAVMAGLKGFQRDAVEHVIERFYGAASGESSGRFLVADETGLGKSIVARGVIAKAIEHLQDVDHVDRIDIVYVCSNVDLATQNLRRLNVTGDKHIGMATRLTLLAKESRRLSEKTADAGKKVNLVSFTPGTSFSEGGWRQGSAPERAMLTVILDRIANRTDSDRRVTRLLMHGTVKTAKRFDQWYVQPLLRELAGEPDPRIVTAFTRMIEADGSLDRFVALRDEVRRKQSVPAELWQRNHDLIAEFRQSLAKAGVDTLEPDLIILDEFQRFRHLLDPGSGDAAELAHALFEHPDAKVLLLSATPYKPFTNSDDAEDDHYQDFLATVRFLAGGAPGAEREVAAALAAYRQSLVVGCDAAASARRVSDTLTPLMTRSERPPIGEREDLVASRHLATGSPTAADLREWASLRALGRTIDSPVDLEYWKSIPYFASFMDGYKAADRVRAALEGPDAANVGSLLATTRSLEAGRVAAFEPVDLGNGHLRALANETIERGWWKLLWVPPTMPYHQPGPIYAPLSDGSVTKHVVFSAWTGVPTAIASLLSYEADRLAAGDRVLLRENTPDARKAVSARLQYRLAEGRPAAMSTLALFWPHPGLAELGDPLQAARAAGATVSADALLATVDAKLTTGSATDQVADAVFAYPGMLPALLETATAEQLVESRAEEGRIGGLLEHVRLALAPLSNGVLSHPDLARVAVHSPGNIAWRALRTIAGPSVTPEGLWLAAFELVRGIRTLFNRTESIALLVTLYGDERPFWRSMLDYCADGNLQAVMDEYMYQLLSETGGSDLDDAGLAALARRTVESMELRPARYVARDNTPAREEIPIMARFALRYGGKYATDSEDSSGVRQAEVRAAFNSPFAPFVLASTSVGQEGIDFHWWSHSVVHWNLPSNPVDFEQREGRVNRFAGHAVRKNVAEAHWPNVLASNDLRAWRAAFDAAAGVENELGEFSPWWVYPGSARIHRVIAQYPLSRDIAKYERLRSALTLYRLTLGQPRQEDMVDMLAKRGVNGESVPTIDLRPPRIAANSIRSIG